MTLKEFIAANKLTTTSVARDLGVSQPFIWRLVNGDRSASPRLAVKIEGWSKGAVLATSVCPVMAEIADRPQRRAKVKAA